MIGLIEMEISNQFLHEYREKSWVTASICRIARFLKSGIPIYNSEDSDAACRKTRRRVQAIAKRCTFHANVISYNLGLLQPFEP